MKIIIVYLLATILVIVGIVSIGFTTNVKGLEYIAFLPLTGMITYPAFKFWIEFFNKRIKL